jgi:hypothetical protein
MSSSQSGVEICWAQPFYMNKKKTIETKENKEPNRHIQTKIMSLPQNNRKFRQNIREPQKNQKETSS